MKAPANPDLYSQGPSDSQRRLDYRPLLVAFSLAVSVVLLVVFTLILTWQVR